MKKNNLLQRFEYAIMATASYASLTDTEITRLAGNLPLMRVIIDFEKGKFLLEGDWQFMMASNRHSVPAWFSFHPGRVMIEAEIYPAGIIDLDDEINDGLLCPVKGTIKDGGETGSCSGLIVLVNTGEIANISHHNWDISFYLYDYQFDDCEIKFKLPVYAINGKGNIN